MTFEWGGSLGNKAIFNHVDHDRGPRELLGFCSSPSARLKSQTQRPIRSNIETNTFKYDERFVIVTRDMLAGDG